MVEPELAIALGSGLASVGYYGYLSCFGKKRKLHKERLCALVLGKHTGKTRLKESLDSISKNICIVDVNAEVEASSNKLNYLVDCKDYVKKLLKEFPKGKFLLLCDNMNDALYYGVNEANIFVCCPSNTLFKTICSNITPSQTGLVDLMEKSRMELVRSTDADKLNIFSSFDELYTVIKNAYKLQSTF